MSRLDSGRLVACPPPHDFSASSPSARIIEPSGARSTAIAAIYYIYKDTCSPRASPQPVETAIPEKEPNLARPRKGTFSFIPTNGTDYGTETRSQKWNQTWPGPGRGHFPSFPQTEPITGPKPGPRNGTRLGRAQIRDLFIWSQKWNRFRGRKWNQIWAKKIFVGETSSPKMDQILAHKFDFRWGTDIQLGT